MKMVQRLFWVFIFGILVIGGIFAQEEAEQKSSQIKRAYIQPTFALGFGVVSANGDAEGGIAPSLEIDFVNDFGLTLGLQNIILGTSDFGIMMTSLGAGYTYYTAKWSAGGQFMFVPFATLGSVWGIGFDFKGTYWFKENLGVTGIMDLYFPKDTVVFSMRTGISFKY